MINRNITSWKLCLIGFLLFVLNDFFFICYQKDYTYFIIADYGIRVLSLVLLAIVGFRYKDISFKSLGKSELVKWTFLILLIWLLLDTTIDPILDDIFPCFVLYKFPKYPNVIAKVFDLTFGLALVAVSEEILFRGVIITWLKNKFKDERTIIAISCLIFGIIHWGAGISSIVTAALFGILPAKYYLKDRKLMPCILGHYFANLLVFI